MKNCALIIGALAMSCVSLAQVAPHWTANFNGPFNKGETNPVIAVDGGGNTYVSCESSEPDGSRSIYTIKYDAIGNQTWSKKLPSYPEYHQDSPVAVKVDGQGNVFVGGTVWSGLNVNGTGGNEFDYVVAKYSSGGDLLWKRLYDDDIHWQDLASDMILDDQGNVIITGQSHSRAPADHPIYPNWLNWDWATVKYDTNGNVLWVKRYNDPDYEGDFGMYLASDAAGNVYVSGMAGVNRGGDSHDMMTVKYDAQGNKLWEARAFGDASTAPNALQPRRILVDGSGNVYVPGWDNASTSFRDVMLIKYNAAGQQVWRKQWARQNEDVVYDAKLDQQGNVYIGVSTEPVPGIGAPTSDSLLLKYAPDGTLLWQQIYAGPDNLWDGDNVLSVDADGNAYVGIQSQSVGYDYTLLKYSPGGVLQWVWKYDNTTHKDDLVTAMEIDPSGMIHMTGMSNHPDQNFNILTLRLRPETVAPTQLPIVTQVSLDPTDVVGGQMAVGTVTINARAPVGGVSVQISTSDSDYATAQGFCDIPEGQTSSSFLIYTQPRPAKRIAIIATYNGQSASGSLGINTTSNQPQLRGFTTSGGSVRGGSPMQATVTLSAAAPAGGQKVYLHGTNGNATNLPAYVTVPAGASTYTFDLPTRAIPSDASVQVMAAAGPSAKSVDMQVRTSRGAGTVVFSNYVGTRDTVTLHFRPIGSSEPFRVVTVPRNADGSFAAELPYGRFELSIKEAGFLRKTLTLDTTAADAMNLQISLVNGDVNGDNAVSLADFAAVRAAFGSSAGDANWNPRADLNGDGAVTLADFAIVRGNYGQFGDN